MVADAVARAHRLMGDEVFFLTGTDEHGQKVERAAQKAGLPMKAFADEMAQNFRRSPADAEYLQRRLHPHHRTAALRGGAGAVARGARSRLHLQGQVRGLVLHGRRGVRPRNAARRRALSDLRQRRSRRSPKRATSSSSRPFSSRSSSTTASIPISSRRRFVATRCCRFSRPASRT